MRWVVIFGLLIAVTGFAGMGVALPMFCDSGSSTDRIEISMVRRFSVWDRGWRIVLEGQCWSGPAPTERANAVLTSARGYGLNDQEGLALQCNQTLVFGESNPRMWAGTLMGVGGLVVAGFGWHCRRFAAT